MNVSATTQQSQDLIRTTANVALLAIVLGLVMQVLVIAVRLAGGASFPGVAVIAEAMQSVTWSLFVCVGVSIATSVSKARKALAGLLGFVFAPLGLAAAKAVQRATLSLLDAIEQPVLMPVITLGTVRAIEYGLLAWILTTLAEREIRRPGPYLLTGGAIGLVGGIILTALTQRAAIAEGTPLGIGQIAGTLVSEIGSPLGCALVILVGQILPQHAKALAGVAAGKKTSPDAGPGMHKGDEP